MPSLLSPRPGYSVIVSQLVGGRPVVLTSCTACDWPGAPRLTVPLDDDDAAADIILTALHEAIRHVSSHISERATL